MKKIFGICLFFLTLIFIPCLIQAENQSDDSVMRDKKLQDLHGRAAKGDVEAKFELLLARFQLGVWKTGEYEAAIKEYTALARARQLRQSAAFKVFDPARDMSDEALQRYCLEMVPLVEKATGMRFAKVPQLVVYRDGDIHAFSVAVAKEWFARCNIDVNTPENQKHFKELVDKRKKQIPPLGKYLPSVNQIALSPMVCIDNFAMSNIPPKHYVFGLELVIAHELTHAMQKQRFGRAKSKKEDADAFLYELVSAACDFCIEGHAELVMELISKDMGQTDIGHLMAIRPLTVEQMFSLSPDIRERQRKAADAQQMYHSGHKFMSYQFKMGGEKKVWRLLTFPPASISMLFKPETYSVTPSRGMGLFYTLGGFQKMLDGDWAFDLQTLNELDLVWRYRNAKPRVHDRLVSQVVDAAVTTGTPKDPAGSNKIISIDFMKFKFPRMAAPMMAELESWERANVNDLGDTARDTPPQDFKFIKADMARKYAYWRPLVLEGQTVPFTSLRVARGDTVVELLTQDCPLSDEKLAAIIEEVFRGFDKARADRLAGEKMEGWSIEGQWKGTVVEPGGKTYPVVIDFFPSKGTRTFEYPTFKAGGIFRRLAENSVSFACRENLDHGKEACVDGATVEMKLQDEDTAKWSWKFEGMKELTATLTRVELADGGIGAAKPVIRSAGMKPVASPAEIKTFVDFVNNSNFVEVGKQLDANPTLANADCGNGWTALHAAVQSGRMVLVKSLLLKGADPSAKSRCAPIHLAVEILESPVMVKLLVSQGADINGKDQFGQTALHMAAFRGDIRIAKSLVSKGADVNARNEDGDTPLHQAVAARAREVVELLLSNGARVNARSLTQVTPLHVAAISEDMGVMEILLSKGAEVNARALDGNTPMAWALSDSFLTCPDTDMADLLRQRGGKE